MILHSEWKKKVGGRVTYTFLDNVNIADWLLSRGYLLKLIPTYFVVSAAGYRGSTDG